MMNTTIYTKEQINAAVRRVLTNQFKKDAKRSHEIVEEAGYIIVKCNKGFAVKNLETRRYLYTEVRDRYTNRRILHYGNTYAQRTENFDTFDYVGCLDKPINTVWQNMQCSYWDNRNKAEEQFNELKHKQRMVQYYQEDIDRIQKKMEELQKELIRAAKNKSEAEINLKLYRIEIGLH